MFLAAIFSFSAMAESPNPPRAGRWEARAIYSYFKSDSNFSSTGNTGLVGNGAYSQMQGDFSVIYDWQPDWRFAGGFNAAYAESFDGIYQRSNSGMNEVFAMAQKWYESGPFDIAPQVDFVFPFWRPDQSNDEVLIGEGAMRIKGGAWGFWPLGTYKPFAYIGFEYRDGGRAFLLPYEAGIKFKFPRFWVQGSFRGYETVVEDADRDNQVVRESYLKVVNAGSLKYYSVNPSASEAAAEIGGNLGAFGVIAGFAISVNGNNSGEGWTAYGGLTWSPEPLRKNKYDDGFNIRKERYDEDLFEGERSSRRQFVENPDFKEPATDPEPPSDPTIPPPPPARPAKPVEMSLELRRTAPKKPNKSAPRKRGKNLDKMMDDAESSLENAR